MKKPIFPRILGLLLLYIAVFAGIVSLQFAKQSSFTHRNGSLVVSGFYHEDTEEPILSDTEFLISGDASVFFQEIEFMLSPERGFMLRDKEGQQIEFALEKMAVIGENIDFTLSDGSIIKFHPHVTGESEELRILSSLNNTIESVEVPIKIPRTSQIDANNTLVITNNSIMYMFNKTSLDVERNVLILSRNNPSAQYAAIPDAQSFTSSD
jgi:hypothetical protein